MMNIQEKQISKLQQGGLENLDFNKLCPKQEWGNLQNYVKLEFLSKSLNVALARTLVSSLIVNAKVPALDMTISQLEEIKVAVSEGVSNAIIHGYENQEDKTVVLQVFHYDYALIIQIIDTGVGIPDVAKAMEPAYSTVEERMGLGFAFMNSFMDELLVKSQLGVGTELTLIKNLPLAEV